LLRQAVNTDPSPARRACSPLPYVAS
jgi:hypothetical protein